MSKTENLFQVHLLNSTGISNAEEIQCAFDDLVKRLVSIVGGDDGREMALVFTKLQEASFFAKRAMAMRPENQKDGWRGTV